jgi:hypothetical protein
MTQDEIIEMAEQAGIKRDTAEYHKDELIAFAKLVAAKEREDCGEAALKAAESSIVLAMKIEREACAKVCETGVDTEHPTVKGHIMKDFGASTHLANAIRARGKA